VKGPLGATSSPPITGNPALRSPIATRHITSAITGRSLNAWRTRLPSRNDNRRTYISWTWDETNLFEILAGEKSNQRRRWKLPKYVSEFVRILIGTIISFWIDYYYFFWVEYEVVGTEKLSPAISITTVRPSGKKPLLWFLSMSYGRERTEWRYGVWFQWATDYMKSFPRIFGHRLSYTPLPPIEGQDPTHIRILVHREDHDDITTDGMQKKMSTPGALIRIGSPHGNTVRMPEGLQQVVILASGVMGIAPVLQTIHTLLEARKDKNIGKPRPMIHVVWFKTLNPVDENGRTSNRAPPSEISVVDQLASAELERLRSLHSDHLVVEPVEVSRTFEPGVTVIESTQERPEQAFLHPLSTDPSWGPSNKLFLISGSSNFAKFMSSHKEGWSYTEHGVNIDDESKRTGWGVLDLSASEVCN
ncbi:hypothetical protein LSUE1_G010390, partial [Lachnellula suecica]